jgi:hypothetical protein
VVVVPGVLELDMGGKPPAMHHPASNARFTLRRAA